VKQIHGHHQGGNDKGPTKGNDGTGGRGNRRIPK
jgi:hypothetical protein